MPRIKLPYGIKGGQLVHVAYEKKGANCECVCPKCAGALVAAKGEVNVEHFRHQDLSNCEGASEFAIRAKIMELLKSSSQLTLPASLDPKSREADELVKETTIKIESIQEVSSPDPLTPRFEIKTSDHSEEERITVVVNLGKKAPKDTHEDQPYIEINLSDFDELSEQNLKEAVQERIDCWRWIKRPLVEKKLQEKLNYNKILTTPEEAERLMTSAHRRTESTYYKPSWDGAIAQKREPTPAKTSPRKAVELSCQICGRTNVPEKEMQCYKSNTGIGVCWACLRSGKS